MSLNTTISAPTTLSILVNPFLCPQFNFVGKILGPQGNTIKRLQEETGAKISVLGKGSMRDKVKVRMEGGVDRVRVEKSPFVTNSSDWMCNVQNSL